MYKLYYRSFALAIVLFYSFVINAQTYADFFGNGHQVGLTVSSSHELNFSEDDKVISGTGIFPDEKGASRFLAQATMGANYEAIQDVVSMGIDNWLDNQFAISPISFESEYTRIYNEATALFDFNVPGADDYRSEYLSYTFYEKLIKQPDVLRQKVAFALSQIFVISPWNSTLVNKGYANSHYYDVLYLGAFGNFHDMFRDITLHPCMGVYLSHMQNQKADVVQGTLPDENYAREIMQLFSIGLYELHVDGSFKTDSNGDLIPTYDIEDIQELARVFTGLAGQSRLDQVAPEFYHSFHTYDLREPMAMYYDYHDKREKVLVDNTVIPAGQTGHTDIDMAVNSLYNHPNVAPFLAIRLIQHLVKSNPSPQYVFRVASVFNNDGTGVRGNLQEVIRAIFTDPEARSCSWMNDMTSGKLLQPMQRLTNLFLTFDITTPSNKFWFRDLIDIDDKLEQAFLASPTVFNFFTPFYAEKDFVAPNGLVSPEFQILNATTGMYYLNETENRIKISPFSNRTKTNSTLNSVQHNPDDVPVLDFSDEIAVYQSGGIPALIDRLDLLMCRGQLQAGIKNIIINTLNKNIQNDSNYDETDIVKDALYYIMITPNYTILK